jgi:DNA polymerase-3 subunit delta'
MGTVSGSILYPWLDEPWQRLNAYLSAQRLPQALLIHGADGIGKTQLAETFAQKLLCRNPGTFACGDCAGCRLFLAGTHPDFLRIEPAERGKPIAVDAVRHLIANLSLKPQYGGYRIVAFCAAHQLNISAANALLKTLEEPGENTVMLLLTDTPSALPATIFSRCQRLAIPLPDNAVAARWLEEQGTGDATTVLLASARYAPLKALALVGSDVVQQRRTTFSEYLDVAFRRQEPISLAERWSTLVCDDLIDWIISWTTDLIRLRSIPDCPRLDNPDLREGLETLADRLHLKGVFGFFDLLLQAKRALSGQANRQLLLEELLIHWAQLGRSPQAD